VSQASKASVQRAHTSSLYVCTVSANNEGYERQRQTAKGGKFPEANKPQKVHNKTSKLKGKIEGKGGDL